MRIRVLPILLIVIVTLLINCGGATALSPSWAKVSPDAKLQQRRPNLGLTLDLPANWMMIGDNNSLVLTRHSMPLDVIQIRRDKLPASLSSTELKIDPQMNFVELAEVIINNIRATSGVFDLVINEVAHHEIDGHDGFRVFGVYKLENGIARRCMVYGFINGDDRNRYYTEIGLYALEDHYFNAVVDDFLALVNSVKVD